MDAERGRARGLFSDLRFDLFAVVFAVGTLHHELQFILEQQRVGPFAEYMERWGRAKQTIGWPSEVGIALHLADILIAVLVLVLPWRRALLCLLAVPFLLSQLASPERIASHNSLMAGALAVLLVLGVAEIVERASWRGESDRERTDWYSWTLIGLSWLCALTYIFAAFHKLSPTVFWPPRSQIVDLVAPLLRLLGVPRDWTVNYLGYPLIYGTVILEAVLPLLLFWRPTRLVGCFLGLAFHLPQMAMGVLDFPTLIVAFYPLFLSLEEARALVGRLLVWPSIPRLVSTAVLGGAGVVAISRAAQPLALYSSSRGLEPVLASVHSILLGVTFILFVHVALTLVAWGLRRGATPMPAPLAVSLGSGR
ncbi:MAG: HTTM domain-containing protein [Chloroflexi bacterium]|nr:HTTM domain-containing protein [Chloroflexota bacterium]